jgi:uncharacterized repeat protein (TIGR01451 family)
MALLPGSAAIGAGTTVSGITTDQRGQPLDAPTPDIGAFQSHGFSLSAVPGSTPQAVVTDTAFTNPLALTITANDPIEPVAGGVVNFTVNPAQNGASASLSAATAIIGPNGIAQVTATANSIVGSYTVKVSAIGAASPANYNLKNLIALTFSGIVSQSIAFGTASATFSGTLVNGAQTPRGENVAVTLDGVTQQAAIGSSGAFSTTFDTAGLAASTTPYTVSYVYASDGTFGDASTTSSLTITKVTPIITWANPANITYGTALSSTQLDATSSWAIAGVNGSVAGTFTYTPVAGTVLKAGTGQALTVTFTPTDTTDYNTAADSVAINVDAAAPIITWANPADITYGTALSSTQLDATSSWTVAGVNGTVAGTFTYTPAAGTVLTAGAGQALTVTFTPTDTTDYKIGAGKVTINVDAATPTITWAKPADITYGTALSATQLNASSSWIVAGVKGGVAGTFAYTPAAGTILPIGTAQTLSVAFTPTDLTDYTITSDTVTINVVKATLTIAWLDPADITYGTALSATQLDATASVPGTFTYTPAAGTVLHGGTGQTLSVMFTPTDTTDYATTSDAVKINVDKATPNITWADPADIPFGTALSATQLDATASVPGTFTYTPDAGTVLPVGTGQALSVVFVPSDSTDYDTVTATATATVLPSADLLVQVAGPATGLVGQNLVYTVTATNNGPSPATGVVVTDTLRHMPTDVTFVSTSTGATPDLTGTIAFNPVSLASGASISYVITIQPTLAAVPDSPLIDVTHVAGDEFDSNLSNNSAQTSTTVSPAVDLAITQFTAAPKTVQIGDDLTYTIVVTNNGPIPATAVTVTSPLGTSVSYVTGSGTVTPSGTVNLQGSSVVASLGTLAQGDSATLTFMVVPSAIGTLTVTASVTSNQTDTSASNNSATVSATVADRVGTIEFSQSGYAVPDNAGSAAITVSRVNGARGTVTVDYKTVPINALPGLDYTPVSGTLTFPNGVTSETIVVPVLDNPYDNHDGLLSVVLSNAQTTETLGQPILGAPSTATLTIQDIDPNFNPLIVTGVQWTGTAHSITQIFVTFSKPLLTSTAINPADYALVNVGREGKHGTTDDSGVAMSAALYHSSSVIVVLTPDQPLPANRFFQLSISSGTPGGVEDVGANMLAGNGTTAGTSYTAMLARGTSLKYSTPAGDQVSLRITGGGFIDDLLSGSGQGIKLSVVGEVPHHTVLSGTVRKVRGGTGQAYLGQTIWGLGSFGDVRVLMSSPPFFVGAYPFPSGSAASLAVKPKIVFSPVAATASSSKVVSRKPASRRNTTSVSRTMNRPFHSFRDRTRNAQRSATL